MPYSPDSFRAYTFTVHWGLCTEARFENDQGELEGHMPPNEKTWLNDGSYLGEKWESLWR